MTRRETWYVLEDSTAADPRHVRADTDGLLRHRDGRAVAYAPHGPRSRSVDPDEERAHAAELRRSYEAEHGPVESPEDRQMKPARRGRRYRTRAV